LEADIAQSVSEPFRPQNSRFLFCVHLEHSLPRFEIDHEELEIVEGYSRSIDFIHETDNLATNIQVGTASNVIIR
jgi:hypothetical protein